MTDLTPEELRRACELAGLRWDEFAQAGMYQAPIADGSSDTYEHGLHYTNPALPAYVAELLVAEICRRHMCFELDRAVRRMTDAPACLPTHARIRAAMEVLE